MQDSDTKAVSKFEVIGQNLRKIRKESGLTQRDVSHLLGVSFQQIQKYERGENRLPVEKLFLLKNHLGVSFDIFFEGLEGYALKQTRGLKSRLPMEKNEAMVRLHFTQDYRMKNKIEKIILMLLED